MTMLRDVSKQLWPAVQQTLSQVDSDSDKDAAAAKLAQRYAQVLDETPDGKEYYARLRWLGPELLKVLVELGATPASRAAIKQPKPQDVKQNGLQQLRDARTA